MAGDIRFVPFVPKSLTDLQPLQSIVKRILDRWPDVVTIPTNLDPEWVVRKILQHVQQNDWARETVKLSQVLRAARFAFDEPFVSRAEIWPLHTFLLREIEASTQSTFLSGMFAIYLSSYQPGASHTVQLANALSKVQARLSSRWADLIRQVPEIFDPVHASDALAKLMAPSSSPRQKLIDSGIRNPGEGGLMYHTHLAYVRQIGARLNVRRQVEILLDWLCPNGKDARQMGATAAIEALLKPWHKQNPDADLQGLLTEKLVHFYRDPRLGNAPAWEGISKPSRDLIMRWLTQENIRFFLEVVSAVEDNHMWQPRRDFWLGLYERGLIDEAWVAFSQDARDKANELRRKDKNGILPRFGVQNGTGTDKNTSLLIMRCGELIVVEGSHSFRVLIFERSDPRAPRLFQNHYDGGQYRGAPNAENYVHRGDWQSRVAKHIYMFSKKHT
jgi:hypothetical protein